MNNFIKRLLLNVKFRGLLRFFLRCCVQKLFCLCMEGIKGLRCKQSSNNSVLLFWIICELLIENGIASIIIAVSEVLQFLKVCALYCFLSICFWIQSKVFKSRILFRFSIPRSNFFLQRRSLRFWRLFFGIWTFTFKIWGEKLFSNFGVLLLMLICVNLSFSA